MQYLGWFLENINTLRLSKYAITSFCNGLAKNHLYREQSTLSCNVLDFLEKQFLDNSMKMEEIVANISKIVRLRTGYRPIRKDLDRLLANCGVKHTKILLETKLKVKIYINNVSKTKSKIREMQNSISAEAMES